MMMDAKLITLRDVFGYHEFKPFQEEAVDMVLQGKDCIITARTGFGKTEVWGIPHVMQEKHTLVITPTVALTQNLEDRVKNLPDPQEVFSFSALNSHRDINVGQIQTAAKCIILSTPEQTLVDPSRLVWWICSDTTE